MGRERHESHDVDRVVGTGEGFVLVCSCGWRSGHAADAASVGHEWDVHRAGEVPVS